MKNLFFLLIGVYSFSNTYGSSNIECWYQLNKIDSLFTINEFEEGLNIYEEIGECKEILSNTRLYGMSQIFLLVGKKDEAKVELLDAVRKGLIWSETYQNRMLEFHLYCKRLGGKEFLEEIWELHLTETDIQMKDNEKFLLTMREIEKQDQLQRDKIVVIDELIYDITTYDNYKDDPLYKSTFKDFRERNAVVLYKFISIVDSLGYVPSDKEIFGQCSMQVMINHSSAYPTSVNLDSIYRYSIDIGTISPKAYANFIGYKAQKQGTEDPYMYACFPDKFDTMSEDEKDKINKARMKIGLALIPNTMNRRFGIE